MHFADAIALAFKLLATVASGSGSFNTYIGKQHVQVSVVALPS